MNSVKQSVRLLYCNSYCQKGKENLDKWTQCLWQTKNKPISDSNKNQTSYDCMRTTRTQTKEPGSCSAGREPAKVWVTGIQDFGKHSLCCQSLNIARLKQDRIGQEEPVHFWFPKEPSNKSRSRHIPSEMMSSFLFVSLCYHQLLRVHHRFVNQECKHVCGEDTPETQNQAMFHLHSINHTVTYSFVVVIHVL